MKCYKCGKGIDDGVEEMLPIDPKGTPDRRWACIECAKLLERCTNHIAMTNGDKIRSMTDEQLSELISDLSISNCGICPAKKECYKNGVNVNSCGEMIQYWLKQEAK